MGLVEVLRLNVCFVFDAQLFLGSLDRFLSIRATDAACHQEIFSGDGDFFLFGNAIHHNYSINLPTKKNTPVCRGGGFRFSLGLHTPRGPGR